MSYINNKFILLIDGLSGYRQSKYVEILKSIEDSSFIQSPFNSRGKQNIPMMLSNIFNNIKKGGCRETKVLANDQSILSKTDKNKPGLLKTDKSKPVVLKTDKSYLPKQKVINNPDISYRYNTSNSNVDNISNSDSEFNKSNVYNVIDDIIDIDIFDKSINIHIRHKEPLLIAFCTSILPTFSLFTDINKDKFIKDLKYKMSVDLDKEDLYKKFNYNSIKFKKADFQFDLINNNIINIKQFYIYLGDYFNINFIIKEGSIYEFMNKYDKNRYSFLSTKITDSYIIHFNCNGLSLLKDEQLRSIPKFSFYNSSELIKERLEVIQNVANGLGINIKKEGKRGFINKTKKDLIEDIHAK